MHGFSGASLRSSRCTSSSSASLRMHSMICRRISTPHPDRSPPRCRSTWVYAPMQLLVGVLFDRYGTKYIVSTAAMICGVGCIVSQADGLVARHRTRFIGVGSAFAFVGAVYGATVWFSPTVLH